MQATKDTFLNHLATRLAESDSSRTVVIDGVTRPAVMVCENERPELMRSFEECYCIDWNEAAIGMSPRGVQTLVCSISYWTKGSGDMSGVDRGRKLTVMDELLRKLLVDRKARKVDLAVTPAADLGSNVFWDTSKFGAAEQDGMKLQRTVKVDVHYFGEEQR
jgi:hypothetical protein